MADAQLGRDDHRQRGLAEPGRSGQQHVVGDGAAHLRPGEHEFELFAHPVLADELAQVVRSQRRVDVVLAEQRGRIGQIRVGQIRIGRIRIGGEVANLVVLIVHRDRPSMASARRSSTATSPPATAGSSVSSAIASTASPACLAGKPRPPSASTSWSRHGVPAARPAAAVVPAVGNRPDLVPELQDQPLGALLADAGRPGQRRGVAGGQRPPQVVRARARPAAPARSSGPTPVTDWTSSNRSRASSVAKPNRVSESSRTTSVVASVACSPRRQGGQGGRRRAHGEPDAADLDHRVVQGDGQHGAAHRGDHRTLPADSAGA